MILRKRAERLRIREAFWCPAGRMRVGWGPRKRWGGGEQASFEKSKVVEQENWMPQPLTPIRRFVQLPKSYSLSLIIFARG